ncbi:MAG: Rieske 2Fe-2S domain-containing protein [Xanthobacteraceae bacterium]
MIAGAFLRNAWYVAAWADELDGGRLVPRTIMNEPVVLYRKENGEVAAIEDRCAHRFAPLSLGKIVGGDRIQCPYHGLEFDGSGACVRNPHGAKTIPSRARVKSYPAVEKHKAVWLWMGAAPPDATKIPDFSVLDDVPALHTTKRDSIVIKANYQLIVDNLLDLSHTSYLHEGILGNADTVESEITAEQDGDDVVVGRHATNSKPPGMFAPFWPDHPPRVDKFTKMRWMAPSTLRLLTGICGIGAGDRHRLSRRASAHARERALDALLLHRCALGREDRRRHAQPRSADAHCRNAPLCLRRTGRAGDRGAAARHRDGDGAARSADPLRRRRLRALQARARQDDRGGDTVGWLRGRLG